MIFPSQHIDPFSHPSQVCALIATTCPEYSSKHGQSSTSPFLTPPHMARSPAFSRNPSHNPSQTSTSLHPSTHHHHSPLLPSRRRRQSLHPSLNIHHPPSRPISPPYQPLAHVPPQPSQQTKHRYGILA